MHHKRGCGNYQKCKTACYTSVSYEAIADPFENSLSVSAKPEAGYKEGAEGNGKIVVKIFGITPIYLICNSMTFFYILAIMYILVWR